MYSWHQNTMMVALGEVRTAVEEVIEEDDGVAQANARLIAAAPELLSALKDCMEMSLLTSPKWDAAIAKAEGRE